MLNLERFIPAGAGNGKRCISAVRKSSVHPRGCGERRCKVSLHTHIIGSSPRVRGTAINFTNFTPSGRFIPAGAGNGTESRTTNLLLPVHPRGCGERKIFSTATRCLCGSSPRVRGTVALESVAFQLKRFIPAGAGNGKSLSQGFIIFPVHPRGCGERPLGRAYNRTTHGSSPRVRGTDLLQLYEITSNFQRPKCYQLLGTKIAVNQPTFL